MNISHAAIWVYDLETMRQFYEQYFGATVGLKYENPRKHFMSYFLSFDSGARLELMQKAGVSRHSDASTAGDREYIGFSHLAFSTGSEEAVDLLTEKLSSLGIRVLSGPRRTGDGYYESVIADPEGNTIEITK